MRDRIVLEGLRIDAPIGVYPHERERKQRLELDLLLETDVAAAAARDLVGLTVDYDRVARIAEEVALSVHHELIETVADHVARKVLESFADRVSAVTVRVAKPGAVARAANVRVEVRRERGPEHARALVLGRHRLELGPKVRVMGVVNATPDSFYDRGRFFDARDPGPAIARAEALAAEGAEIIDVGGETAQPSSPVLSIEEEIARVVPVIRGLAGRLSLPISVDTYKPEVAQAAIEAGASLINDTSGLADARLARVAAETGAGIVVMHIVGHPKERRTPGFADVARDVTAFLAERAERLMEAGVPRERILLDPGIGFAKTPAESLRLTRELGALRALGFGLLYACSRRTFLGELLGGLPPEDRLEPTVALNAVAMLSGADVVRVHDVRFFARLTRTLELLRRA